MYDPSNPTWRPPTLEVHLGRAEESLSHQLQDQGVKFVSNHARHHYQKDADAISRLKARGILTDAECRTVERRLLKRLSDVVVPKKTKEYES